MDRNERLTIVGKGGKRRTVLLDGLRLVQQLRAYQRSIGYKHGALFRAKSMHERWDHTARKQVFPERSTNCGTYTD